MSPPIIDLPTALKWSSPGGRLKKFTSSNADLCITWYSGKQNSLTFQGHDGCLVQLNAHIFCEQGLLKSVSKSLACNRGQISCSTSLVVNSLAVVDTSNISYCEEDGPILSPKLTIVNNRQHVRGLNITAFVELVL